MDTEYRASTFQVYMLILSSVTWREVKNWIG